MSHSPKHHAGKQENEHHRAFQPHAHTHTHAHPEDEHADTAPVERIRERHRHKHEHEQKPRHRWIFWTQLVISLFVIVTAGFTIRAIEMATIRSGGISWLDEFNRGEYAAAMDKFSITASEAVDQVFSKQLTSEKVMADFNAALPHLRRAGYVLTEMEVEVGFPPKLIPHFYHDPDVKLDKEKTLKALGDNSIGAALLVALAEAGALQRQIAVADMQFNHIEVELGPIPSLKLQYKNDHAIKDYIHGPDPN